MIGFAASDGTKGRELETVNLRRRRRRFLQSGRESDVCAGGLGLTYCIEFGFIDLNLNFSGVKLVNVLPSNSNATLKLILPTFNATIRGRIDSGYG